ncbi:MAG: helix-turn-helix domain-containing protein, partial [Kiritimatiellae bacterium]|nr:helix-turn-helix domain-containing protein [Kiritimatiellia bacterium]
IAQRAFSSSFAPTGGGRHLKGTVLLLSLLTNLFTGPARTGDEDNPPELRVEKALEADPRRVPIKELAARLGMSPNTLRRRFRRFMNKNPQAFKTDHSLHLARYYILHTQLTFKVIAKRLGFSSASYFTTFIRQHTGKTPREMRKTRTGNDDE